MNQVNTINNSGEVIRDRVGAATAYSPSKKLRNSVLDSTRKVYKKRSFSKKDIHRVRKKLHFRRIKFKHKNELRQRDMQSRRDYKDQYLIGSFVTSYDTGVVLNKEVKKHERRSRVCFSDEDLSSMYDKISLESHSDASPKYLITDEIFNFINTLRNTLHTAIPGLDSLCSNCEDLFLTIFLICKAQTLSQILAVSALYLKHFVGHSLIYTVLNSWRGTIKVEEPRKPSNISFINEAFEDQDIEGDFVNGGYVEAHMGSAVFVDFLTSWRSFTQMDLFKEIGRIITIMVTVGLFPHTVSQLESYKIFDNKLFTKQLGTFDLVECILTTMDYVVKCSYSFYKGRGFEFLTQRSSDIDSLEMKMLHLKTYINSVVQGSYFIQTGKEVSYFQAMLIETRNNLVSLVRVSKSDRTLYAILQKKLEVVTQIEVTFENSRCFTSQREAPYCINIFGGSARGKSSLSQILSVCILKFNGFDHDDTNFSTIQSDDKFYSTYRADTTCVVLDDVANTVTDKAIVNPADRIIMIKNNVSYFAPKADVSEKGKIPVQPRLLTVTTNVKDINASDWSQEPVSVVRRFDCIITAKVRPEFSSNGLLDQNKVFAWGLLHDEDDQYNINTSIPDLWLLTVEKVKVVKSPLDYGKDSYQFEIARHDGKFLQDVDIYSVIDFLKNDSSSFYLGQKILMNKIKGLGAKIEFCDECSNVSFRCVCPKKCEEQSLVTRIFTLKTLGLNYMCVIVFYKRLRLNIAILIITLIYPVLITLLGGLIGYGSHLSFFSLAGLVSFCIYFYFEYYRMRDYLESTSLRSYYDRKYEEYKKSTIVACGVSVFAVSLFIFSLRKLYNSYRRIQEAHGNLQPSVEDISARDAQPNVWTSIVTQKLPLNENTITMSAEQLSNKIIKNCVHVFSVCDDKVLKTCGVFVQSNILMVPSHYSRSLFQLQGDKILLKIVRANVLNTGSIFQESVILNDIFYIPDTDLCLIRLVKGGVFNDITIYYPEEICYGSSKVVYMDEFGERKAISSHCSVGRCSYLANGETVEYKGGKCIYNMATFRGLCMAVHITNTKNPRIIGHHIAGYTGTTEGRFCFIAKKQIEDSLRDFQNRSNILSCHSGGTLDLSRYGVSIPFSEQVYDKAPLNFIDACPFKVYGSIGSQSTYYSEVKKSRLSDDVAQVMGVVNIWGKPQFTPRWKPWYDSLYHMSNLAGDIPSSLLDKASRDYISVLLVNMEEYRKVDLVRPLNDYEIINGIHGKRFIDSVNYNSSIGFPLTGAKGAYVDGLPGFKSWKPEKQQMLYSELDKAKNVYLRGERYYPIFKACLKDEPTLLSKDKVRVFMASDFVLQYYWRKYGLPLLRFLSLYPLDSEIAVGINCYSDEWQQMIDHVTCSGEWDDRIVAGDYSKWDLRLPIKVVLYALSIIVKLAESTGEYTADDIQILRGVCTDTAYFVTHYNGSFLEVCGGMASGHNVTAHLNSICNALLLRVYFYSFRPAQDSFRDFIKAIFYGDDFIAGVKPGIDFNFIGYQAFLSDINVVLTMPDKIADPVPYLRLEDTDFLKRKSVYSSIMGHSIGALSKDSMYKSLHCHTKLKCTVDEHDISVLSSFLMEAFAHGEDFYEKSLKEVTIIATKWGLVFPNMFKTYVEMGKQIMGLEEANEVNCDDYSLLEGALQFDRTQKPANQVTAEDPRALSETLDINDLSLTNNTMIEVAATCAEAHDTPSCHSGGPLEAQSNMEEGNDNLHTETGVSSITNATETMVTSTPIHEQDILTLRQHDSRSLEYYMSRPYKILNREIAGINFTFSNVMLQFLSSPRIRDKIRGYAYLNGKIHIKVMVNAPLRCSGALLVALSPWHVKDNGLGRPSNDINPLLDVCQMSQLPHIVVDLSTECGGEISLPIITPTNGLDITDLDQIRDCMSLMISPLVAPQIDVGDANAKPFINIVAWMTDVSLTGTTIVSEIPVAQSDEYSIKPKDQPSTIKAALRKIYMKGKVVLAGFATDLATAAVYSLMGLSKPFNLEPVCEVVRRYTGHLACFNGQESIPRLTGDIKQEVLVDSQYLGYDLGDEMDLNTLSKKKAIVSVNSFQTDLPPDTNFYKIMVSPCSSYPGFLGASTAACFTPSPVALCTLPFSKWRGGLKYTFQAVGSAFMRGKIKIAHDCIGMPNTNTYDPFDFQILNHVIWDLSQNRQICVHIPWTSNFAFKDVPFLHPTVVLGNDPNPVPYEQRNGILVMNNITPIIDPVGNSISIITWVEATDDFVWSDPRPVLANYTFAGLVQVQPTAQSGSEPLNEWFVRFAYLTNKISQDTANVTLEEYSEYIRLRAILPDIVDDDAVLEASLDVPIPEAQSFLSGKTDGTLMSGNVQDTCVEVNITGLETESSDDDVMLALCAGEKYTSIRQIIKRYTQNFTRTGSTPNNTGVRVINIPDRPIMKGWQGTQSLNVDPSGIACTYARDSFLSYFSVCFLGYRGGFNHKVVFNGLRSGGGSRLNTMFVARSAPGYFDGIRNFSGTHLTNSNAAAGDITRYPDIRAGGMITTSNDSGLSVLEYNTPYNSNGKFLFAQNRFPQTVTVSNDTGNSNTWHSINVQYTSTNVMSFDKYVSAADDFSLFFFKYTPRMRFESPVPYSS